MAEDSGVVYVGRKPPMNYVTAVITSFSSSEAKNVTLKARGRAITTAVDVAEIVRRRFMKDLEVSDISIGSEEMPAREGRSDPRIVSTMNITLTKK